ncbi:MAG TPA: hypothetical protein VNX25_06920 [Verrucomicrobiae bacterium]|nr:hypothetical protein [Verrucomicrobiae bacterium]
MWVYPNRFGLFKIEILMNGKFGLFIDDDLVTIHDGPHEAAEAVFSCRTGFTPWDRLRPTPRPEGLEEWGIAFSPVTAAPSAGFELRMD